MTTQSRYRVEYTTGTTVHHTAGSWRTRARGPVPGMGKPTDANLANHVAHLNASFGPDGVNSHISDAHGNAALIVGAKIVDQDDGTTVATFTS